MAADGDVEKSPFRCLAVARYAVASVVTVLILIVAVKAIKVILRSDSVSISISQGSLFTTRLKQPPTLLAELSLQININTRSLVRIYLVNFTMYVFDTKTPAVSSHPAPDSLLFFPMHDNVLQHGEDGVDAFVQANGTRGISMEESIFDMLYNKTDTIFRDVTMRLEGNIITELHSGYNTTPRWTTYYCWPLFFGVDPANIQEILSLNLKDVFCREVQGRHFI